MTSFGEELRRERELREISLREVAEATKISLRYLEAMERNDFTVLPGGLYNKGFVRQYCEYIGVDADSMIDAYLLEERTRATPAARRDPAPLRRRAQAPAPAEPEARAASRPAAARWWLWLVIAAVLGTLLFVILRAGEGLRLG